MAQPSARPTLTTRAWGCPVPSGRLATWSQLTSHEANPVACSMLLLAVSLPVARCRFDVPPSFHDRKAEAVALTETVELAIRSRLVSGPLLDCTPNYRRQQGDNRCIGLVPPPSHFLMTPKVDPLPPHCITVQRTLPVRIAVHGAPSPPCSVVVQCSAMMPIPPRRSPHAP